MTQAFLFNILVLHLYTLTFHTFSLHNVPVFLPCTKILFPFTNFVDFTILQLNSYHTPFLRRIFAREQYFCKVKLRIVCMIDVDCSTRLMRMFWQNMLSKTKDQIWTLSSPKPIILSSSLALKTAHAGVYSSWPNYEKKCNRDPPLSPKKKKTPKQTTTCQQQQQHTDKQNFTIDTGSENALHLSQRLEGKIISRSKAMHWSATQLVTG